MAENNGNQAEVGSHQGQCDIEVLAPAIGTIEGMPLRRVRRDALKSSQVITM